MNRSIRPHRVLGAGVIMTVALLMISQSVVPTSVAQGGFDGAFFDVIPDSGTGISSATTGSTFFLKGTVITRSSAPANPCAPSGSAVGTWRAWGVVADGGRAVINHSITLEPLNGSLELQGTTGVTLATGPVGPADPDDPTGPVNGPTEVLSLVGGSGTFRGALGEAQIRPYCSTGSAPFKYDRPFCLQIKEARRRGNSRILSAQ
ncbi:MAG: hypothetical protein AB1631_20920 [Acidobacteriota bacterium]